MSETKLTNKSFQVSRVKYNATTFFFTFALNYSLFFESSPFPSFNY